MNIMMRLVFSFLILMISIHVFSQNVNKVFMPEKRVESRQEIVIPDIDGYKVMKCDFHIHTVFSDGDVWPDYRVSEAWKDGLDAIAITDHIEYRPHSQ
jgi:3',5'-nucleoside bisphosphate phosphatase